MTSNIVWRFFLNSAYIVFQYRLNSVVGYLKFLTNTQKKIVFKSLPSGTGREIGAKANRFSIPTRELFNVRNRVLQESKKMKENEGRYGMT